MKVLLEEVAAVRTTVAVVYREHAARLYVQRSQVVESRGERRLPLLSVEQDADPVLVVSPNSSLMRVDCEGPDSVKIFADGF